MNAILFVYYYYFLYPIIHFAHTYFKLYFFLSLTFYEPTVFFAIKSFSLFTLPVRRVVENRRVLNDPISRFATRSLLKNYMLGFLSRVSLISRNFHYLSAKMYSNTIEQVSTANTV